MGITNDGSGNMYKKIVKSDHKRWGNALKESTITHEDQARNKGLRSQNKEKGFMYKLQVGHKPIACNGLLARLNICKRYGEQTFK